MSASRFPPSERDFRVYEYVEVGGATTRQAASFFDLSQTRVCQIVERVAHWQAEVVPLRANQFDEQDLLALGKNMAGQRLRNLYGEALDAWRRSQGETVTLKRETNEGVTSSTTKTAFGQASFLHVAIRATMQMAKMAVLPGLIEGLQAAAIEGAQSHSSEQTRVDVETLEVNETPGQPAPAHPSEGMERAEASDDAAAESSPPGECSSFSSSEPEPALGDSSSASATDCAAARCESSGRFDPPAGAIKNGPVQTADGSASAFSDAGGSKCGKSAAASSEEARDPPIVVVKLNPGCPGATIRLDPGDRDSRKAKKRGIADMRGRSKPAGRKGQHLPLDVGDKSTDNPTLMDSSAPGGSAT